MLTDKDIQEFRKIWENKFNKKISYEMAYKKANRLINLCNLLFLADEKIKKIKNIK